MTTVVAEATLKTIKTAFINGRFFEHQKELNLELFDYMNWYNTIRILVGINNPTRIQTIRTLKSCLFYC